MQECGARVPIGSLRQCSPEICRRAGRGTAQQGPPGRRLEPGRYLGRASWVTYKQVCAHVLEILACCRQYSRCFGVLNATLRLGYVVMDCGTDDGMHETQRRPGLEDLDTGERVGCDRRVCQVQAGQRRGVA